SYFRDSLAKSFSQACAFWPKGSVPRDFRTPVVSDVPVLLLSGELDPVTPPKHADEARAQLRRSTSVIVPGVGHGTAGQGCVPRLVFQFLDTAGEGTLPLECLKTLKRPPFFVSFAGPPP